MKQSFNWIIVLQVALARKSVLQGLTEGELNMKETLLRDTKSGGTLSR